MNIFSIYMMIGCAIAVIYIVTGEFFRGMDTAKPHTYVCMFAFNVYLWPLFLVDTIIYLFKRQNS